MRVFLVILLLFVAAGCNSTQPIGGAATGASIGYLMGNVPGAGIGAVIGATAVDTNAAYYDRTPKCLELRGCVFQ
ncbi:MAG: hypothetical protein AAFW76_11815 [Pseudomonadota bacterium]